MKAALLALLLLSGCGGTSPTAEVQVTGPADLGTTDQRGRDYQRMDIDQLDAAIRSVTGGISWTEQTPEGSVNLFEKLSGTLGKPEYLDSTTEDLVPGLLFQKFLADAAASACTGLIEAEKQRAATDRTFLVALDFPETATNPAAVEENLRHALLIFHGRDVPTGDPTLAPWRTLVADTVAATSDPAMAWRAACVALILHPDFYSY